MNASPRQQGSTVLFVIVGVLALLLVAFVIAGATLVLRRPRAGHAAASATVASSPPPPPPPVGTEGFAPVPTPTIPSTVDPSPFDAGTAPAIRDAGAPPKTPIAGQGTATVTGSLPADTIRSVVKRHMGSIRYCYEQGLKITPSLAGKVTVHFVIGTSGSVATASESSSTLGAPTVVSCIVRVFERMVFPAPSGGVVSVDYPLVFASAVP